MGATGIFRISIFTSLNQAAGLYGNGGKLEICGVFSDVKIEKSHVFSGLCLIKLTK